MKIVKTILVLLLLINLSGCGIFSSCEPKDGVVCYDNKTDSYVLEDGAVLNVAVPNEAYGQALVSLWDTTYPDHAGVVTYTVLDDRSAVYYYNNNNYDLIYISETELPMIMDQVQALDEHAVDSSEKYQVDKFAQLINSEEYRFVPLTYNGFLFAYDETMLNDLGISLTDSDNDGLPDSIDTWEEIFTRITAYNEGRLTADFTSFFPLAFNEKYSFYGLLTGGGWEMFSSLKADDPGFDTQAFRLSLNFIYDLGKYSWNLDAADDSSDYVFQYEDVLANQSSPLTLIASWMYYQEYENINECNYRFAHMPSYGGNIMTPLVGIEGYAISSSTLYPGAANQLLTLIRSKAGLEMMLNSTDLIPIIALSDDLDITISDQNKYDMIKAYAYSIEEPLIALSADTTIRAWQLYYDCDWLSVIKQLYDHQITVSEAQQQIEQLASDWLTEKGEIAG
ncbi:MAG: extracellular solute-binding protein [Erysipelotrichaceae bacterium]|nr:extracellular solute-binding protein [Erysipelotrichaceae bacterium]